MHASDHREEDHFTEGISFFWLLCSLITAIISTRIRDAAQDMIRQRDISSPERGYRSKNRYTAPDAPESMIQIMKKNNIVFMTVL